MPRAADAFAPSIWATWGGRRVSAVLVIGEQVTLTQYAGIRLR
jgi:hypothetical protein